MLNDIVVSNSEAMKQIDSEIKSIESEKEAATVAYNKDEDDTRAIKAKKRKYFNKNLS